MPNVSPLFSSDNLHFGKYEITKKKKASKCSEKAIKRLGILWFEENKTLYAARGFLLLFFFLLNAGNRQEFTGLTSEILGGVTQCKQG